MSAWVAQCCLRGRVRQLSITDSKTRTIERQGVDRSEPITRTYRPAGSQRFIPESAT